MYFCTSLLLELVSKLKSGEGLIKGGGGRRQPPDMDGTAGDGALITNN